jgi:hypothetical protein
LAHRYLRLEDEDDDDDPSHATMRGWRWGRPMATARVSGTTARPHSSRTTMATTADDAASCESTPGSHRGVELRGGGRHTPDLCMRAVVAGLG